MISGIGKCRRVKDKGIYCQRDKSFFDFFHKTY